MLDTSHLGAQITILAFPVLLATSLRYILFLADNDVRCSDFLNIVGCLEEQQTGSLRDS